MTDIVVDLKMKWFKKSNLEEKIKILKYLVSEMERIDREIAELLKN